MACQPQVEDSTSSRTQTAPINIAYGNQETQRFWRDTYRWNNHQNQFDDDEEEEIEQNHHSEADEEQVMMMYDGFSGGVIDEAEDVDSSTISISSSNEEKENDVVVVEPVEQTNNAAKQQKTNEMSIDLFEQLLAENERKLRQLISYVENRHLVLK